MKNLSGFNFFSFNSVVYQLYRRIYVCNDFANVRYLMNDAYIGKFYGQQWTYIFTINTVVSSLTDNHINGCTNR